MVKNAMNRYSSTIALPAIDSETKALCLIVVSWYIIEIS